MEITPFHGKLDVIEDPNDYIDDVLAVETATGYPAKALFRKNLRGRAVNWYSALEDDVKGNWNRLSSAFKEHFEKASVIISLDVRMSSLEQQASETTEDYFERCKDIWALMPREHYLYYIFGKVVAEGMMDDSFADRFIDSMESRGEELSFSNFLFFKDCMLLEDRRA